MRGCEVYFSSEGSGIENGIGLSQGSGEWDFNFNLLHWFSVKYELYYIGGVFLK